MDFVEVLMFFGEGKGFLVAIPTFSAAVLRLTLTLTNYLKKNYTEDDWSKIIALQPLCENKVLQMTAWLSSVSWGSLNLAVAPFHCKNKVSTCYNKK